MGKYISERNSDLLYDGIDEVIEEFAPFLRNEPGATLDTGTLSEGSSTNSSWIISGQELRSSYTLTSKSQTR